MTITRDQMKTEILTFLNKQPSYQGFFSDDKINQVIQESVDYLATRMMLANEGWLTEVRDITTTAGAKVVSIPTDVAIIYEARYLSGDVYYPLVFDQGDRQWTVKGTDQTQFPYAYRIVGNQIYFDPALAEGGTDYLQLECAAYPAAMANGSANLMTRLDRCFQHYIKYRCAGILVSQMGKFNKEWQNYENEWANAMVEMVEKRVRQATYIREFEG